VSKYKISLSPRYDTYWGREELALELHRANLLTLLPANNGVKRAFFRQMDHLNTEGIQFVELKESTRDKSWSVYRGLKRKPIGSILVTWGQAARGAVWQGSKVKFKYLTKTTEGTAAMDRVKFLLTDALTNPGVNAYTFHKKVLEYFNTIADIKLPRTHMGINNTEVPQISYYYVIDDKYKIKLQWIESIYIQFGMSLNWEGVM
jgi:hypothetical protein